MTSKDRATVDRKLFYNGRYYIKIWRRISCAGRRLKDWQKRERGRYHG